MDAGVDGSEDEGVDAIVLGVAGVSLPEGTRGIPEEENPFGLLKCGVPIPLLRLVELDVLLLLIDTVLNLCLCAASIAAFRAAASAAFRSSSAFSSERVVSMLSHSTALCTPAGTTPIPVPIPIPRAGRRCSSAVIP